MSEDRSYETLKAELHTLIAEHVFITNAEEQIGVQEDPEAWIFDFRKIIMNAKAANTIADVFYHEWQSHYPFQLCALEIAGVPLVTTFMNKFFTNGHHDMNAFFIRKSRKKSGLLRMIEGEVESGKDIILVDDIMNSGNSFWRQIEVLEELGHRVHAVWSILRFRDEEFYQRFHNRDIKVHSLFTLDDFTKTLNSNVRNLSIQTATKPAMPFTPVWRFQSPSPSYFWVVPKSQPVLDESKIYFGSDNRTFWALNQHDGTVAWQYSVGMGSKKKSIFSNPLLHDDLVIFGSYDGGVYALDKETGTKRWLNYDADWIGSSPDIAPDLGLVFIGLEFGLLKKRGGISALDVKTGKTIWSDRHPAYTHASPIYIKQHKQVAIGSNDGKLRLYNAKNGTLQWTFTTFGGADFDTTKDQGFSSADIKERAVYDAKNDYLIFGSIDGFLYILERKTGHLVHHHKCGFGVWGTPCVYKNRVYFSSLDKRLRCIDLSNFELMFEVNLDNTRIFANPVVINDLLYIGTNAARLHEIDPETGALRGYFQALERITNAVVYSKETDMYFLPTFGNEIIALRKKDENEP